jgi:hypothetical protein
MTDTFTLALTSARVSSPGGINYRDVQVAIDGDTITLRSSAGLPLGTRSGIVDIEQLSADIRVVSFADGNDPWTIARGGCGCRGSV